jgi:arsenate reductase (glutaredoxin)
MDCFVASLLAMTEKKMPTLKIYTLATCATCRRAVHWLRAQGIAFDERPIRETPPKPAELRAVLVAQGGKLRALFNVSGRDYREQKLGDKLPAMSEAGALALLAGNGNLVKRPLVVGDGVALVGFDEKTWVRALASR